MNTPHPTLQTPRWFLDLMPPQLLAQVQSLTPEEDPDFVLYQFFAATNVRSPDHVAFHDLTLARISIDAITVGSQEIPARTFRAIVGKVTNGKRKQRTIIPSYTLKAI